MPEPGSQLKIYKINQKQKVQREYHNFNIFKSETNLNDQRLQT